MPGHTERDFETAIEAGLTSSGGYETRSPGAYDETLALFPDDVTGFLEDSQPAKWAALAGLLGPKTAATALDSLAKELDLKGTLHVLRHGFKCYGKTFRMAWFRPNTSMNPEAAENYAKNRLTIARQIGFTSVLKRPDGPNANRHRRCIIDVTLAINGIPVVTAELKNPLTGQRAADAMQQYAHERDERDLLFAFKKRALVHFAVDPDEVWMTTRLRGKETHFLPFNRGNNHGAGNPPAEGNWKTHYLWDEVLQADSLLEILQRFMHLEAKEKQVKTDKGVRTVRKETMIFPRYHQLDAVRRLVAHAKAQGAGRNYLIQHSAGSGKSNSIAWLAHRLASLHDAQDEKVSLSRLNRIAPGKSRTFVLDFANEEDDIFQAFKPYYETTPVGENADPQRLSELQHRLLEWAIFTPEDVTAFAQVWYRGKRDHTASDHKAMNAVLDTVVQRFQEREEQEREEFHGQLTAYRNLYAFLSQIIPYQDSDLERLYTFVRNLLAKLPPPGDGQGFVLDDEVALRFFRLQQMTEGSIDLAQGDAYPIKGPTDVGTGGVREEAVSLSSLIDTLNERFGTDFTEADQLFFDQIRASAESDEKIAEAARANNYANFSAYFDRMLDELFIARMEGNEEIFSRVMTDAEFRSAAHEHLAQEIFRRVREQG